MLEKRAPRLKVAELAGFDQRMAPQRWRDLSKVPYAEIDMQGSPFFNESHERFRLECRRFFWEEGIVSWAESAENSGKVPPKELYQKLGAHGYLALCMGPGPHLRNVPEPNLMSRAGIKPDEIDLFHFSILAEERARMCCPGAEDGMTSGISIGLGPVLNFGQPWTKTEVVPKIFSGDKIICLAITEPQVRL